MSIHQLYVTLLVGGGVVLVSIAMTRFAARLGLPSLLLYLAVGVVLGEDGIGIRFDNAQLAQNLGTAALAVILIEGGLTTRWSDIRSVMTPAGVLATVGVAVSTLVTAAGAHLLVGLSWQLSLLLGATVSSTDAAAVFAILRVLPLPRRVAGLLEAESGFNDAPTVILVILFSTHPFHVAAGHLAWELGYELAVGAAMGLVAGWLGARVLPRVALPASGLYPLAVFGLGAVAFGAAGAVHASGFLAAYLAALVLANAGLPHRAAIHSFAEGVGWLAQIGLFVLLGLLVTPSRLPSEIGPALAIGAVLLLLSRPLSVAASLTPFKVPLREQLFLSWAGLRGAVPIVLATFPIVHHADNGRHVLHIVFVLVVAYTLLQGPSLGPVARWLGVAPRDVTARQIVVESAPLDVHDAELLTLTVPPRSGLVSVSVLELRLPEPAVLNLIIRDGHTFVPSPDTQLQEDDEILVVTTRSRRDAAERRLRAVGRRGPLAHWFGEYGAPD